MRIHKIIIAVSICFVAVRSMAQSEQPVKYRKFSLYAGAGPSYFINNLITFKNDVNSFNYAFSFRAMWEPQHSFVSLGIETGYYRLYTVNSTVNTNGGTYNATVKNYAVPIQLCVSMKFSKNVYANWSMGQSFLTSKVSAPGSTNNFNSSAVSLSDLSATIGYRFIQKERISYAAELKGFYSAAYDNTTISLLFIVGFKL